MPRKRYSFCDAAFLQRLERLRIAAKSAPQVRLRGRRSVGGVGDSLEFADHRSYSPGDDIRFVDWPYFARMEKLLLRLFHRHSEAPVAIMLDASASMGIDRAKFDFARRTAAMLAYAAMGGFENVILAPLSASLHAPLHAGRDRRRVFDLLDALEALEPAGPTQLEASVREFMHRGGESVGGIFLVSDLLECADQLPTALAMMGCPRRDVTVLHVISPADAAPAHCGAAELRNVETGDRLSLNLDAATLEQYRRQFEMFCSECRRSCTARGATYVAAHTHEPTDRLALVTLRRAWVVE